MKRMFLLFVTLFVALPQLFAVEGMWLLPSIDSLNYSDMKRKGFKLSPSDIYSPSHPSMLNSVVIFGAGCSGSVISANGLILTNHHCGYAAIQRLSTPQHNYLKNGYWAYTQAEELAAEGTTVTFIRSIEDVTQKVLSQLPKNVKEAQRQSKITKILSAMQSEQLKKGGHTNVIIKPFYGGNSYYMFEMDVYTDVRLVGTPPSSIGKFGGDTDNWMWPRHTGDFSLFRVYGSADGKPSKYSAANIPLSTPKYFPLSIKGVKKGDFTMLLGFPGSTNRFLTSYGIEKLYSQDNPIRIDVRGKRQQILMDSMLVDSVVNLKYASKYSISSNYWKNAIGMNEALKRLDVAASKKGKEDEFVRWMVQASDRSPKYGKALEMIKNTVEQKKESDKVASYIFEALNLGVELVSFSSKFSNLELELEKEEKGDKNNVAFQKKKSREVAKSFFNSYCEELDRKVAKAMVEIYTTSVQQKFYPKYLKSLLDKHNDSVNDVVDFLYDSSMFVSQDKLSKFLENPTHDTLLEDPAFQLSRSIKELSTELTSKNNNTQLYNQWARVFIKGYTQMISEQGGKHYPDANFTIRMSYGTVQPYLNYDYTTHLSGVIAKEDVNNPYEFTVEPKLKELYKLGDTRPYGRRDVVVAFISDNDITGGNSGSPVINGKGELIGAAFDGNWEAMSGDLLFEPNLQRTISVDVRYILFIIDKYAGCQRIIDELTIVK